MAAVTKRVEPKGNPRSGDGDQMTGPAGEPIATLGKEGPATVTERGVPKETAKLPKRMGFSYEKKRTSRRGTNRYPI